MGTKVSVVIGRKGSQVATIAPTARVKEAVDVLSNHRIGAVVVSSDGRFVEGILSERDVMRGLSVDGPQALDATVGELMTHEVVTCGWDTTMSELMTLMTERRIRHVPVVEEDRLVAIVSIGDVVKSRLDELAEEADQLQAYVSGGY